MKREARALLLAGVCCAFLVGGCKKFFEKPTPTEPTAKCDDMSGAYRATFSTSCGQSGTTIPVTVTQTSCDVTVTVTGLGTLTGTMADGKADITLEFATPCTGEATGTATISSGRIDAAFAGSQTGTGACCSVVSGTVSIFK